MQLEDANRVIPAWPDIPETEHPGKSGETRWRTVEAGSVRIRMVEYSPGYEADHWCTRGHVLLVLRGELTTRVRGKGSFTLRPGMSYQVAEDLDPHLSSTAIGATALIID